MASKKAKFSKAKDDKKKVIKKHAAHDKDTGSPRVQVALLTERINYLIDHLKSHKNDKHSRRGLIKLVSQRRKMIKYMQNTAKDQAEVKKYLKSVGL